jgi:hypothetical protein
LKFPPHGGNFCFGTYLNPELWFTARMGIPVDSPVRSAGYSGRYDTNPAGVACGGTDYVCVNISGIWATPLGYVAMVPINPGFTGGYSQASLSGCAIIRFVFDEIRRQQKALIRPHLPYWGRPGGGYPCVLVNDNCNTFYWLLVNARMGIPVNSPVRSSGYSGRYDTNPGGCCPW